jgi:hypothetical protein
MNGSEVMKESWEENELEIERQREAESHREKESQRGPDRGQRETGTDWKTDRTRGARVREIEDRKKQRLSETETELEVDDEGR